MPAPFRPSSRRRRLVALLALGALACTAAPASRWLPRPTDHRLEEGVEAANKAKRKAWFAERHAAPPGVDWKAIERANGEQQRRQRNAYASLSAVADRWTEIGSRNQAGRMHVAARAPDGQSLYAGSSLGGVWHGTLDGQDWTPLGDNIYGGAHWLAVVPGALPTDPPVVLRATDDGLIHATRDDGQTWEVPAGLPVTNGVRRVFVTADGSHTIVLVLHFLNDGGQWRYGAWHSADGARNFTKFASMNTFAGDMWASRTGAGPLYVLKTEGVQTSTNLGQTWTTAGPLPAAASGGELVGSEAGAPRLWVALDVSGTRKLYRSDDAGASWTYIRDLSDYWGSLAASTTNVDLFAYGGVEVWRTTNAGSSFAKVNGWGDYYANPATKLHADIPGIDVLPTGPGSEIWYVSTDGGLYRSTDGLATVANLSLDGLRVSQYYTTHTSLANPVRVIAGAQDQGYQRANQPAAPGTTLLDFAQLISGDYGHATSGDGTHAYVYSTYPGFLLIQKGETGPQLYTADFPASGSWGWLPTVTADPTNVERVFFCADKLWRYKKSVTLPPSWSATQFSTQNFALSGGEYLSALEFSPLDPQRVYAATSAGRLWRSTDGGLTWTLSASTGPGPHYFYGTALVASALDVNTAYVGGSGYGTAAVRRTTDGGLTWSAWNSGLPSTLVYCLAEAPDGSGTMFAGSETTAWRRDPGGAWTDIAANEAPITIYWSVEAVPATNSMRFGTYGRGIWDYAVDAPCGYEAFGVALGGGNTMTLDSASPTTLGSTHVLSVSGGPASSTLWLVYALNSASLPFKGGTLLLDPTLWFPLAFATDAAGGATIPIAVPADPAYAGLPLHWQALAPGAPWALSNRLSGALCP